MKFTRLLFCLYLAEMLLMPAVWASSEDQLDSEIIELAPFVVYGGIIDTVDGFSGNEYRGDNPVVLEFREDFNKLLLGYHRWLLRDEMRHMRERVDIYTAFGDELVALADSFGIKFDYKDTDFLNREKAILTRLIEDPFFIIENLVVWDLDLLEKMNGPVPDSKYAKDIRYNEEHGNWERRITTEWKVEYYDRRENKYREILKEQGLNLDTNEGYHFINQGLGPSVYPGAFQSVRLSYPIFYSSQEPVEEQVKQLKDTFVLNLKAVYDPFSWAWRREVRFRPGKEFRWHLGFSVENASFRVSDRDWFDKVLTEFLVDVITIKHYGIDEIYRYEMATKIPVKNNMLGEGLNLLNWNKGENRSVAYDPKERKGPNVNFNGPGGARFILLDAYRRFENRFVDALRERLENQKQRIPARQLVMEVIAEVSGIPGEKYVELAAKAQREALIRFRQAVPNISEK